MPRLRGLVAVSGLVALVLARGKRSKREATLWTEAAERAAAPDLR